MMRGECIFAWAVTEEDNPSDIAQTPVGFIGMTERFHFRGNKTGAGRKNGSMSNRVEIKNASLKSHTELSKSSLTQIN
jgi:hypothetical protein